MKKGDTLQFDEMTIEVNKVTGEIVTIDFEGTLIETTEKKLLNDGWIVQSDILKMLLKRQAMLEDAIKKHCLNDVFKEIYTLQLQYVNNGIDEIVNGGK